MAEIDLDAFARDYHEEVLTQSKVGSEDNRPVDTFTRLVIEDLVDAEVLSEGQVCPHEERGVALSGYQLEEASLDLFVTHYTGGEPPPTLDRKVIGDCFRPLTAFLKKVLKRYYAELPPGTPVFDMALEIYRAKQRLKQIRLFLFTDGRAGVVGAPHEISVEGISTGYHIWDIQELFRFRCSGQRTDPIHFDFREKASGPIPCIALPDHGQKCRSFLAILPGQILFDLYEEFGPRLLELNVRSFLQTKGAVNRGIQETIRKEPDNFFAFNNGISTTAESIVTVPLPGGGLAIAEVSGLQIVNGGQTTASIHHAVRHLKADVSKVCVQAKFSEVPLALVETMVPRISEYSNSQNKVSKDDFYANHAFHIEIEKLSRSVVTLPQMVGGKPHMTHWFYERARGQYAEAARAAGTGATAKKKFQHENPPHQRFGKTELAKFLNTWDGFPYWVSMGSQKNFLKFADRLRDKPDLFNADTPFFQRLVALAVLFRKTEEIVKKSSFPAYRANVVTYSLAYLAHWRGNTVDLDGVWREQSVPDLLVDNLTAISREVYPIIDRADGGNVTEWCKKAACWDSIREARIKLDSHQVIEDHAERDRIVSEKTPDRKI